MLTGAGSRTDARRSEGVIRSPTACFEPASRSPAGQDTSYTSLHPLVQGSQRERSRLGSRMPETYRLARWECPPPCTDVLRFITVENCTM